MTPVFMLAAAALVAIPAAGAQAQEMAVPSISGTRLDVVASGEAKRVPDIVQINAGVVTQASTAGAAIDQNARRMAAVRAALRGAGIADRDIQTSAISLNPNYAHSPNAAPRLTGYQASNQLTIRFRDIASTGKILDTLVAQGINQFDGPMLTLEKPEEALNEARTAALSTARARAETYAAALGKRVRRVLSVSEAGQPYQPYPRLMAGVRAADMSAGTSIAPGEQAVSATLTVSFELE